MGSWLRALSIVFIVSAGSFGSYILLQGKNGGRLTAEAEKLRPAIDDFVSQGGVALQTLFESSKMTGPSRNSNHRAMMARANLPFIVIEPRDFAAPAMKLPRIVAPAVHANELSKLRLTQAPDQLPMDLEPVEARLRSRVPQEVLEYFDLFLYVSKATPDKGAWAQKMFVLAKQEDRVYQLQYSWAVSTGLEEEVMSPSGKKLGTHTPEGIFKLDRGRSYEDYTSRQWKSPMPYAMFFDWRTEGRQSGLALHGSAPEGEKDLGKRASHGCIRLSTENARTLFQLITTKYRGRVPEFRVDPQSGTMSTKGVLVRDENGRVKTTSGFKVLVFIEDYGGPTVDTVAALY